MTGHAAYGMDRRGASCPGLTRLAPVRNCSAGHGVSQRSHLVRGTTPQPQPHVAPRGRPAGNPGLRHSGGFTLIEMLAVIVLVAIAAAAVAISVSHGLDSARIRAASAELAAALRYTRAQAIVHGTQQTLAVDVAGHAYTAPGRPKVTLPAGMGLALTSAVADRVNPHIGRIRFFPDGSSTGGRITLSHGRREWHVNVAWLTGTVAVVETGKGG